MARYKYAIFVVILVVIVSLIGYLSKELLNKEEDVVIKDTETEHCKSSFPTEKTNELNSQTTESTNTEIINTEASDTETEYMKPIENIITLEPTINSNSTNTSEVQEEQFSDLQEDEVPLAPELSLKAFELINAERVKLGLEPVVWDTECERIALLRAEEIAPYAIPEHDGFIKFQNENRKLCECLAWGYLTEEDAVDGWMNSSAHKDILLDPDYVKLAVVRIDNKWVAINSR